jgi:hypothetical protein
MRDKAEGQIGRSDADVTLGERPPSAGGLFVRRKDERESRHVRRRMGACGDIELVGAAL